MQEESRLLTECLLRRGAINKGQFQEVAEECERTNHKAGEILIRRGLMREEDIARALAEEMSFAYMDISTYKIEEESLQLIPAQAARRLELIPLFKLGNSLTIAMANPLNMNIIDEVGRISGGLRIRPIVATISAVNAAIEKYYGKKPDEPKTEYVKSQAKVDAAGLIQEAAKAPVVNLVNHLLDEAVRMNASDIHLEPQAGVLNCRFRIDGILHEMEPIADKLQLAVISRIKVMAEIDITQTRVPQDGRFQKTILGRDVDLRVASFPAIYGEHISIRILDKAQGLLKLEELGFEEGTLKAVSEIIRRPYGIILVVGPTGSGKTTTLYSILNTINDLKKNIVTLEDPVEYTIPRVNQSQINVKAGLTFATGLRSILRLDPDTIMIGEIRDKETADIAIHSSLTGHLVFSTLHTNDAPSAAARLIDIGVEPYLLSSSLTGVIAQRLVRKLCTKCRIEYAPSKEELLFMGKVFSMTHKDIVFYKPGACPECQNTGYKGRTGIFELLVPDEQIKEIIVKKAPAYEIKAAAQKSGMKVLREDGLSKVARGITTLAEVFRVTEEV